MSDQQPDRESGFRRLIREAKEEAFHARRQLRRELPSPSTGTKRRVAEALADYRDLLWDYHDERVLETPWGEREVDVDVLDAFLSETVTVEQPLNRRGGAVKRVQQPKVARISARRLITIGKELDAIAKELGFAASTKETTPHTETDPKDVAALLKARGQQQALENLPKRFRRDTDGNEA
jgi:hypothetical protein